MYYCQYKFGERPIFTQRQVICSSPGHFVRPAPARSERAPLTREFGLPLYQQIHHLLRHRIGIGEYPPGSKIPSEHDLCRELAVSRVTVREALRELVRADMLIKVHGKGAFVSGDTPRRLQT